ncbi:MAG: 30S ribosomal protein S6 [Bacteroidales bacterium]
MVNRYETVFILTPVLSEPQIKESVEKYEAYITENGGKITHREHWGLKKLAYPIQKKNSGYYHLIEFEAESEFVKNLEIAYRRDERIIRFLTVKLEKYAIQYAEKRRNKLKEQIKSE